MTNDEIKRVIRDAIRDHNATHVCEKEEEIGELQSTCTRITEFAEEMRSSNAKLSIALERLAVGDERLKTIAHMMERNEEAHTEFRSRISNLGRIVEHDHAPVIAGVRGMGKFFKAVALTIVTLLAIGVGMLLMEEWAEHQALKQQGIHVVPK